MEKTEKTNLFLHYKYMLSLVGSVVNEAKIQPPPQEINWNILYKVARQNCFSAMLYPLLKENLHDHLLKLSFLFSLQLTIIFISFSIPSINSSAVFK